MVFYSLRTRLIEAHLICCRNPRYGTARLESFVVVESGSKKFRICSYGSLSLGLSRVQEILVELKNNAFISVDACAVLYQQADQLLAVHQGDRIPI